MSPAGEVKPRVPMSRLPELTRLVRLLTRKHHPAMSVNHLCDELECGERSVKRYIRELRDTYGYPIEFDRELGGYRFEPGKDGEAGLELPGLFFSESELSALMTMRELLKGVRPGGCVRTFAVWLFLRERAPDGPLRAARKFWATAAAR